MQLNTEKKQRKSKVKLDPEKEISAEGGAETEAVTKEVKGTEEYLRCEFSKDEVAAFADELSRKIGEISAQEQNKKKIVSNLDTDMRKLEYEISSLATKVKDKYEFRNVKCEITYDFKTKKKTVVRLDTGEIVKTSDMSETELQARLAGM